MRISVDMEHCESYGQCVFVAPGVFSFDDEDHLVYDSAPDDAVRGEVEKAAMSCPMRAITLAPAP